MYDITQRFKCFYRTFFKSFDAPSFDIRNKFMLKQIEENRNRLTTIIYTIMFRGKKIFS